MTTSLFSEELSESELLKHRADVTARRPTVPQEAGKAFAQFVRGARKPEPGAQVVSQPRHGQFSNDLSRAIRTVLMC